MSGDERPKGIQWNEGRPARVRLDEFAPLPSSAESVPMSDPVTGKFLPGNQAYRNRVTKALKQNVLRELLGLEDTAGMDPELVKSIEHAKEYAAALTSVLPLRSPATESLALDAALACAAYRYFFVKGCKGDRQAWGEARQWNQAHRQDLATLAAISALPSGTKADGLADLTKRLEAIPPDDEKQ